MSGDLQPQVTEIGPHPVGRECTGSADGFDRHPVGGRSILSSSDQRRGQGGDIAGRHQPAGATRFDQVTGAADVGGDHRDPSRCGLDHRPR